MMNLMDILIPPFAMEESMNPIIGIILHHEIHHQLRNNFPTRRQWQTRPDSNHLMIQEKPKNNLKIKILNQQEGRNREIETRDSPEWKGMRRAEEDQQQGRTCA